MKEIHHRVKNNLGVIQSLLSLQLHDVTDEKSKAYFKDARNRVKSMSMIHERLSRSEELSKMDLSEFIKSLANHLFQCQPPVPEFRAESIEGETRCERTRDNH
jgi:two-component sensor histidine kinase